MAVAQEFIDIFIRIPDVGRVYPGGWARYLTYFAEEIGHTIWFDDHLLREGAMSSAHAKTIVQGWMQLGLEAYRVKRGRSVGWFELCVSEGGGMGPTLPCSWIAYDEDSGGTYLKGTEPGPLSWPYKRSVVSRADDDDQWVEDPTFQPR